MGKTDMSYYKDLAIRIAERILVQRRKNWRREDPLLVRSGSKFLKDKFTKPKVVKKKKAVR